MKYLIISVAMNSFSREVHWGAPLKKTEERFCVITFVENARSCLLHCTGKSLLEIDELCEGVRRRQKQVRLLLSLMFSEILWRNNCRSISSFFDWSRKNEGNDAILFFFTHTHRERERRKWASPSHQFFVASSHVGREDERQIVCPRFAGRCYSSLIEQKQRYFCLSTKIHLWEIIFHPVEIFLFSSARCSLCFFERKNNFRDELSRVLR